MNKLTRVFIFLSLCSCAFGEMRTWTLNSGETYEGEYNRKIFDDVVINDASGTEIRFALKDASDADRSYVELRNPPQMKVEFRDSQKQTFPKESPIFSNPSPVRVFDYSFGALAKQLNAQDYNHDLRFVIYAFAKQRYDPDNYKIMCKLESPTFRLTKKNGYRFEYDDPAQFRLYQVDIQGALPRGQLFGEQLILVLDERDEIIAYNTTKNWLYEGLDKINALPINAWIDRKCNRIHPTSPKRDT